MQSRLARALPALALALAAALSTSCSSNNNSTSPTPPVTGPVFSFAFPSTGTPGTSNKRVFTRDEEGAWAYRCIPHGSSGMTGTIIVDASSTAESAFVQVGLNNTLTFTPSTVTIDTGGYVRWANVSAMKNHTVTRP